MRPLSPRFSTIGSVLRAAAELIELDLRTVECRQCSAAVYEALVRDSGAVEYLVLLDVDVRDDRPRWWPCFRAEGALVVPSADGPWAAHECFVNPRLLVEGLLRDA
uniref:Uncharacterized protein n=1 Tax=uncultured prokaryote TaxID=198431 RepID=A0A0H5QLE8_9ZZZZ|nr:hypothetical protein [uncultured prokaryote]